MEIGIRRASRVVGLVEAVPMRFFSFFSLLTRYTRGLAYRSDSWGLELGCE